MCEYGVADRLTDAHVAATNAPIAHRRTVTYQYRTAGDGVVADLEAPIALLRQDGTARARYDYDRAGNLVRRRVVGALAADPIDEHTLVYDGGQRQRAATAPNGTRQVDYYDSSGSRALQVLKGSGGVVTRVRLWFGPLEVWYTPAGVAEKQWAHVAHGVSIARVDLHPIAPSLGGIQPDAVVGEPSGVEFQFHSQLGHMLVSLNESMHAVGGFQYGPFGEVLAQVGSPDDHLRRFNGKEFDKTTGLSYYGFRHYDPLSMTWTQADPLFRFAPDLAFDEPRRMNLYSFSLNNPMRYLDPDGRDNLGVTPGMSRPQAMRVAVARLNSGPSVASMAVDFARPDGFDVAAVASGAVLAGPPGAGLAGAGVVGRKILNKILRPGARAGARLLRKALGGNAMAAAQRVISSRLTKKGKIPTGTCFTAGTLVSTAALPVPIERVGIGHRVLSLGGSEPTSHVDSRTWKQVSLSMQNPDGSDDLIEIELLRSPIWLRERAVAVGKQVPLSMEELGLVGRALVVAILPAPRIEEGRGEVVTGTFTHLNGYVMELRLEGSKDVLEPTRRHRFYSADRDAWVAAAALRVGERLLTSRGPARIASLRRKPGVFRVYNLEVEDAHSYLVGADEVWVHNNGCSGDGHLVRFGTGPETASALAADAAKAEAAGFPHGVSTKLQSKAQGGAKHRSAARADVENHFKVEQTGGNPNHHTVHLPKPVTEETAATFNETFTPR